MISNTNPLIQSAEQLFAMPNDGNRYELIKGVLKMMSPAGSEHAGLLGVFLNDWRFMLKI